jgi:hypothetical protein
LGASLTQDDTRTGGNLDSNPRSNMGRICSGPHRFWIWAMEMLQRAGPQKPPCTLARGMSIRTRWLGSQNGKNKAARKTEVRTQSIPDPVHAYLSCTARSGRAEGREKRRRCLFIESCRIHRDPTRASKTPACASKHSSWCELPPILRAVPVKAKPGNSPPRVHGILGNLIAPVPMPS